jgi:phage terminase large subunit-like protein
MSKDEFVQLHLARLNNYISEITGNTVTVSKYERKSVEYFLRLKSKYLYKEERLIRVLRFFFYLNIPTMRKGIIQAEVMPFQMLWLAAIYCLYVDDQTRLIQECVFSTAKKNNKSTFCAMIALNELINDDEEGAKVFVGANSTTQARIIIRLTGEIVNASPILSKYVEVWKSSIVQRGSITDNTVTTVSTDGKNIQGHGASCSIVDEIFLAKNTEVANKLKTGSEGRTNPLQILISTAGESRSNDVYELVSQSKNILDQVVENDNTFIFFAELDHPDEAKTITPEVLRKANPALGYTVMTDQLLTSYNKAKLSSSDLAEWCRDHLNMWAEDIGQGLWVELDIIKSNMYAYRTKFSGTTKQDLVTGTTVQLITNKIIPQLSLPVNSRVVIGTDFSSVADFTGINIMTYNKEHDEFYSENIVIRPSNQRVVTRKGGIGMQKYIDNGSILQNNLPVLDDELVLEIFRQLKRRYIIQNIGYDERLSGIIIQKIQNKLGLECTRVDQNAYSLGKPLNLIEKYMTLDKYLIAPNECVIWQAKNIVIWSDGNGNKKIVKNGSRDSVDNWVAANIAMNIWLRDNEYLFSERKAS